MAETSSVEQALEQAHRHSLTFLMHACFSIGCYRERSSRLDRDRILTGKVNAADLQSLQERLEKCIEAASDLALVYEQAWSLLVDAHRPQRGHVFAFQCVYDMSRVAVANWQRIRSTVPGAEVLDLIISTGKHTLCSEEKARTYWNDINAEFAVARHKHCLPPELFRHPQADELAALEAMIGDLLHPPAEPLARTKPTLGGDNAVPVVGDQKVQLPLNPTFDFTKSSETSVTAIVRALNDMRKAWPDVRPTREAIKKKAHVLGGAGDRAIDCAIRNKLITPDLLVTPHGKRFLADRT